MIVTLSGSNNFLIREYLEDATKQFLASYDKFGFERLDAEEQDSINLLEVIQSIPLFSEKKLVIIKNPSSNKIFCEKLPEQIHLIPESTDLILVEKKFDKRSSFYKFLKKETDFKELNELDQPRLVGWIVEQVKKGEGSISRADANYLAQRVGLNQVQLFNELQKLLAFDPTITRHTIDYLTEQSPQSTIFELLDAALTGNSQKAMKLYEEKRRMKVEPQQIIATLAWQLHILVLVKSAGIQDTSVIASETSLNPFAVSKTHKLAQSIPFQAVKQMVNDLFELDIAIKSSAIDADQALKTYMIGL